MRAAVIRKTADPLPQLGIEEVGIDAPRPNEVLVRTVATGVCHSDLHFVEGARTRCRARGSGSRSAPASSRTVGDQVTYVKPGDHVIACLSVFCGSCEYCIERPADRCIGRPDTMRAPEPASRLVAERRAVCQHGGLRPTPRRCCCTRTPS